MSQAAPLVVLNLLYLTIGIGLLSLVGATGSWRTLLVRGGIAYMVGVAVAGILAAHLALIGVAVDLRVVALVAGILLAVATLRLRLATPSGARREARLPFRTEAWLVAAAAVLGSVAVLAQASRAFAVRPLIEWDAWAIWATKSRGLFEFGGASTPVFNDPAYAPLQHPLLLPALEAIGFRTIGAFEATAIEAQMIAIALGFAAAFSSLLSRRVPVEVLAPSLFAILAAPLVIVQLSSSLADVPLAFFVALGITGLGLWMLTGERWILACAVLFLGAATLTKPEGALFVFAGMVATLASLAVSARRRLREVAVAAGAVIAIVLPWWIYVRAAGLATAGYQLGDFIDPAYARSQLERAAPAAEELARLVMNDGWGYLPALTGVGIVAAILAARLDLAIFVLSWLGVSFLGLVLAFVVYRQPLELILTWAGLRSVTTLVLTGGALAPLLAGEAWRLVLAKVDRPVDVSTHRYADSAPAGG